MSKSDRSGLRRVLWCVVLGGFAMTLSAASCNEDKKVAGGESGEASANSPEAKPDGSVAAAPAHGEQGGAASPTPPAAGGEVPVDQYPGFDLRVLDPGERAKFVGMARAELCPCPNSAESLHDCLVKAEKQCEAAKYSAVIMASGVKDKRSQTDILDEVAQYVEGLKKTYTFSLEGVPYRGNPVASVVLVEFADFQCPHCRLVGGVMKQVSEKYGDKIVFYYMHFPLGGHPQAKVAAEAAEAAHRQGKFWPMHDLIFENQESLSLVKLRSFGQRLGLNMEKFNKEMESPEVLAQVAKQRAQGEAAKIDGTPALFVNGKKYMGDKSLEGLSAYIDAQLAAPTDAKAPADEKAPTETP